MGGECRVLLGAGAALDLCREQGHQALPLLVEGPQSAEALEAAWRAACVLAKNSSAAAINEWMPFVHACR